MDISNKTLGLLLVAAIVISIGSTVISLDKLDGFSTTGFVTNNVTNGTVNLTIDTTLSIVLDDAAINFGLCTIPGGQSIDVDSDLINTSLNNTLCSASALYAAAGDFLTVRNNGNVDAAITIKPDKVSNDLFNDGASSWIAYKADGACTGTAVTSYANFTTANTEHNFCDDLAPTDSENLTIRVHLSQTAKTGGNMKLTFIAA